MGQRSNALERVTEAASILGRIEVRTSGALLFSRERRDISGWLYAGNGHFLFFADKPLIPMFSGRQELVDPYTLLFPIRGLTPALQAPRFVPNGIINFGNGLEFVGVKKHIKEIAARCAR